MVQLWQDEQYSLQLVLRRKVRDDSLTTWQGRTVGAADAKCGNRG